MTRLRAGEADAVVVDRMSHFGRDFYETVRTVRRLRDEGVQFHSAHERLDLGSSSGRLMFNVMAAFDEYEPDVRREYWAETKARVMKQRGVHLGRTSATCGRRSNPSGECDLTLARAAELLRALGSEREPVSGGLVSRPRRGPRGRGRSRRSRQSFHAGPRRVAGWAVARTRQLGGHLDACSIAQAAPTARGSPAFPASRRKSRASPHPRRPLTHRRRARGSAGGWPCGGGYTHAVINGAHKFLRRGQYCARRRPAVPQVRVPLPQARPRRRLPTDLGPTTRDGRLMLTDMFIIAAGDAGDFGALLKSLGTVLFFIVASVATVGAFIAFMEYVFPVLVGVAVLAVPVVLFFYVSATVAGVVVGLYVILAITSNM